MLTGRLHAEDGEHAEAIDAYEAAIAADIAFMPEILPPLLNSYARSQQMDRAEAFLRDILERYHGISPVLALTRLYRAARWRAGGDRLSHRPAAPAAVGARPDGADRRDHGQDRRARRARTS